MRQEQASRHRLAVVGAARRRQGTGPFVARYFAHLGHPPAAVIGRTIESAQAAAKNLAQQFKLPVSAYTDLEQLSAQEKIDILVIASPTPTHLHYLHEAMRRHCHVFCEKPLWWCEDTAVLSGKQVDKETRSLSQGFAANGKKLYLNKQWPFTLQSFWRLYPSLQQEPAAITEFAMQLSPYGHGKTMVIDSAPHLLSMLHALLGDGTIEQLCYLKKTKRHCSLSFIYCHATAQTAVRLSLQQCSDQPRPAAYAINGHWARRCVRIDDYSLSLSNDAHSIPMPDPLLQSVQYFLSTVAQKNERSQLSASNSVLRDMQQLQQLVAAYE